MLWLRRDRHNVLTRQPQIIRFASTVCTYTIIECRTFPWLSKAMAAAHLCEGLIGILRKALLISAFHKPGSSSAWTGLEGLKRLSTNMFIASLNWSKWSWCSFSGILVCPLMLCNFRLLADLSPPELHEKLSIALSLIVPSSLHALGDEGRC